MHIRLNFHLHENNQRSIKNTTGCNEQISLYIRRSNFCPKFHSGRKKLKNLVIRKYKLYEDTKD